MATDYMKPNPDVKWGKKNLRTTDSADHIIDDYKSESLTQASKTLEQLKGKFHDGIFTCRTLDNELRIEVDPALIPYILEFLRDNPELEYKYLSQIAGAEWHKNEQNPSRYFYVTYDLLSFKLRTRIYIYAVLPKENPALTSVVKLFPTADWHEREVFDLFGIKFEGHPNMTRILLPSNFDGHPLLKTYPAHGKDVWNLGKNIVPSNLEEILGDYER